MITKQKREQGQALILMVLAMVVLLGFTALGIDGARIYSDRREAQSAADAAAMSAALAKCTGQDSTAMTTAARTLAASNGFTNDGAANTVTVNNPPTSGAYAGDTNYIEVILTASSESGLAQFIFNAPIKNTVRAVSRCIIGGPSNPYGNNVIVALDKTTDRGFDKVGSGATVVHGNIFVNSSDGRALNKTSSVGTITADNILINGGYYVGTPSTVSPYPPTTGVAQITDPLASLPPPSRPGRPANAPAGSTCWTPNIQDNTVLQPGWYCTIDIGASQNVTMQPGIYYIETGKFKISGSADPGLTAEGVLIYVSENANQIAPIDISGSGVRHTSGMTAGLYKGMFIYVDRNNPGQVDCTGSSEGSTMSGTTYAPASVINITGSSANLVQRTQYIGLKVNLTGSSALTIQYDSDMIYQAPASPTVSLVE